MTGRGVRTAPDRLRRLLIMLPWIMERGTVPLREVAQRFDLTPAQVTADLELASMCGLPPFVDELIDLYVDDDLVHVGVPRLFTRPLRLTSAEAFELLAAASTAMQLPGADRQGPLGRALDKLARTAGHAGTGSSGRSGDSVAVDLEPTELAEDLVAAAERSEIVQLQYWAASTDEITTRRVLPRRVFTDRGHWYVMVIDTATEAVRTFRIDRVISCDRTGTTRSRPEVELPADGDWFSDDGVPRAVIRCAPSASWIIERYPVDEIGEPDAGGWRRVVLPVSNPRWLQRLAVRVGPGMEILEPVAWRALAAQAAEEILARYREPIR